MLWFGSLIWWAIEAARTPSDTSLSVRMSRCCCSRSRSSSCFLVLMSRMTTTRAGLPSHSVRETVSSTGTAVPSGPATSVA